MVLGLRGGGLWSGARGQNILDGGVPFYRTYRCLDGKYVAVAALETKFFATLIESLGLDAATLVPSQWDRSRWPELEREFELIFATKPRDTWAALFEKTDACLAPVLNFDEAARHPHNTARGTFTEADGKLLPPPAPRFSRSRTPLPGHAEPGEGAGDVLKEWGVQV